jgi:hypothetical protein
MWLLAFRIKRLKSTKQFMYGPCTRIKVTLWGPHPGLFSPRSLASRITNSPGVDLLPTETAVPVHVNEK